MKTYTVPLLKRWKIARDSYAFSFPKPEDFHYTAGQYLSLCVDAPEVAMPGGTMRELSIASAPYESELLLALRFRDSPAKQQYMALKNGDTVYVQGPFGEFTLEQNEDPVIFLAGGIGIVPFLGMLKQALHDGQTRPFFVFCSNREMADIPFHAELEAIAHTHPQVMLVQTLTSETHPDWKHETGYLTSLMIQKYVPDSSQSSFYLSGPQRFVGGMWDMLGELGVGDERIHGEEFTGY